MRQHNLEAAASYKRHLSIAYANANWVRVEAKKFPKPEKALGLVKRPPSLKSIVSAFKSKPVFEVEE